MVEFRWAQKLSIGSSPEVVGFRLADPMGIPGKYNRILSGFIALCRIPKITGPEFDHMIG